MTVFLAGTIPKAHTVVLKISFVTEHLVLFVC